MNRHRSIFSSALIALLVAMTAAGCDKNTSQEETKPSKAKPAKKAMAEKTPPAKTVTAKAPAAEATPAPAADAAPAEPAKPRAEAVIAKVAPKGAGILANDPLDSSGPQVPTVAMTEQHAATCLVKVGDTLPEVTLNDIQGNPQDLARLLGERFSIVFFWNAADPHAIAELDDMAVNIANQLASQGVNVVGVCERDSADTARAACEKAGVSFPVLLDSDGGYYQRLATSKMPRTYLLDASGKILWFDIEYTRATRHDLRDALRALVPTETATP